MDMSGQIEAPVTSLPRRVHGAHCTGGWVGSETGLDVIGRKKHFYLCRESKPNFAVTYPVA
jgi:hypothetical protein